MEKKNQIWIALLLLAAGFGGYTAYTGGFSKIFGTKTNASSKSDSGFANANVAGASAPDAVAGGASNPQAYNNTSGNIPGTNVNAETSADGPATTIKYDNDRFDFGNANEGDMVKHTFKFTNTGKEPLVISNAKGSCGCTVPTWPKEPVAPGASGEIQVEFNTAGKPGRQSKRVTVTANTIPTDTFIEVTGEVKPKPQTAAKGN